MGVVNGRYDVSDLVAASLNLPKLDGVEIRPGVWIIGEPTPLPGTNKLRTLANVGGALCVIELAANFGES